MRGLIASLALAALACAGVPALAFDLTGTFADNATSGHVADLSAHYARGPVENLQLALWTDAGGDVDVNNATVACKVPYASGYETVQVEFLDGTASAVVVADVDNATDPVVVRFPGWACEYVKITPQDASGADYTYTFVLTGSVSGR